MARVFFTRAISTNNNIFINCLHEQKIDYIHKNPVEAGWVIEAHEYYYSSARNYAGLESPVKIRSIDEGVEIQNS